jgi:hypothetical protein
LVTLDRILNRITGVTSGCWWLVVINDIPISDICQINQQNISVHDCFKHAAGQDIFLLDWRQVLSYDVSLLNIHIVVNSVINLVNKNLSRTALQIYTVASNKF